MAEMAVLRRVTPSQESAAPASILIVDDESEIRESLQTLLELEGYRVEAAENGEDGLARIAGQPFDLVLLDLALPGKNGMDVLAEIHERDPQLAVIMITAYGTVENAVNAMQAGAVNFIQKPWDNEKLLADVRAAVVRRRVEEENIQLKRALKQRYNFENIVGKSEPMLRILDLVGQVAPSRSTILIQGESGTGKEVLAKAIHYHSPRAQGQMLELNCAAIPDTLLESELFGYEPGAFTDARRRKEGLLERANHGTLFLDEIGDMSMSTQAKLLRVLEEGSFTRLGGTRPISVDVRIIAATNKDIKAAVAEGKFREDLYYRLNVVPLTIPPLRDRREDVVPLALDLLQRFNRELKKNFTGFTPAAAELLNKYPWPGNIRELKNVIERTMILAPEGDIDAAYLPEEIRDYIAEVVPSPLSHSDELSPTGHQFVTLRELEERYIDEVLTASGQNKTQAARILGIHPTSLLRRLKKQHFDN